MDIAKFQHLYFSEIIIDEHYNGDFYWGWLEKFFCLLFVDVYKIINGSPNALLPSIAICISKDNINASVLFCHLYKYKLVEPENLPCLHKNLKGLFRIFS